VHRGRWSCRPCSCWPWSPCSQARCLCLCPYIPLRATWEAYLAQLSSSHHYLVNRSLREFDAWAKAIGPVRLEVASDPASPTAGRAILAGLHGERWRADGTEGVFASPRFRAFHDAVMPELLARDELELLWLTVGEAPVAAVYSLVWRGRTLFYQSGRRVDLPAKLRPGIVLHAHAIRRANDERQEAVVSHSPLHVRGKFKDARAYCDIDQ
jgi:CelD/BcsL family acetyltransferase involved in cellulose biosynthesis